MFSYILEVRRYLAAQNNIITRTRHFRLHKVGMHYMVVRILCPVGEAGVVDHMTVVDEVWSQHSLAAHRRDEAEERWEAAAYINNTFVVRQGLNDVHQRFVVHHILPVHL